MEKLKNGDTIGPVTKADREEEHKKERELQTKADTKDPGEKKTDLGREMLQMLVDWVKNEFSTIEAALARQLDNDEISYRFLWLFFPPGTIVSFEDPVSKQTMAARVENTNYLTENPAMNLPERLELSTKTIDNNGDGFVYTTKFAYIEKYDAAKSISELQVQVLTPELPLYQTLQNRGKIFVQLNGVHHMEFDGIMIDYDEDGDVHRFKVPTVTHKSPSDWPSLEEHGLWLMPKGSGTAIQVMMTPAPDCPLGRYQAAANPLATCRSFPPRRCPVQEQPSLRRRGTRKLKPCRTMSACSVCRRSSATP